MAGRDARAPGAAAALYSRYIRCYTARVVMVCWGGLNIFHSNERVSLRAQDYADLYALEESLWWFVGMREVTRAVLDPVCPPGRARDVLDAGCGTGGMLTWLGRYAGGGRVAGIDFSSDALDFCRERGLRNLAQASVTAL